MAGQRCPVCFDAVVRPLKNRFGLCMHGQQNPVLVVHQAQCVQHRVKRLVGWPIAVGAKSTQATRHRSLCEPRLRPPSYFGLVPFRLEFNCVELCQLWRPAFTDPLPMYGASSSMFCQCLNHPTHPRIVRLLGKTFRHLGRCQKDISQLVQGCVALKIQSRRRLPDEVAQDLRTRIQGLYGGIQQVGCSAQLVTPARRPFCPSDGCKMVTAERTQVCGHCRNASRRFTQGVQLDPGVGHGVRPWHCRRLFSPVLDAGANSVEGR